MHADADIRLEVPVALEGRRVYVDMIVTQRGKKIFFELKYKTSAARLVHSNELFDLKQQGAADQGLYDCVKDFSRLERFVDAVPGSEGYAVLLTNDRRYWSQGIKENTLDRAFKLTQGRFLSGTLAWADHAGAGSIKGRELAIQLRGEYGIAWRPYSQPGDSSALPFRVMMLRMLAHVGPASAL